MRNKFAALAALLVVAGCTRENWYRAPSPDDAVALVPWFAVMHRGIAIQAYQMPRQPVPGTVPITGVEVPTPPNDPSAANMARINALKNPADRTSESIERGRNRFTIYCSVCHGPAADGNGTVPVGTKIRGWVPSLLTPKAMAYSDGYLYSMIRHGRGLMPAYGDKVRGIDRWDVVNYLRTLQQQPAGAHR
ncbi:MAG TPA: cytochrome c [Gemmatimonadales bacterium]